MNQLLFDFDTRSYPGFDKFLGTANAELVYVLQNHAAHGQFVYVWGAEGAGKSHLLQAWAAQATAAGATAAYVRAGQDPLTEAAFATAYLAVDQVERLDSEEQALLFSVFNRFRNSGRGLLLLASEHPPQQLAIREDLRTRLGYCLVYEAKPLTDAEKAAALAETAAARQLAVSPDIFDYLLKHSRRDIGSLMKLFDTLERQAVAAGRRITLPFVRETLKQETE